MVKHSQLNRHENHTIYGEYFFSLVFLAVIPPKNNFSFNEMDKIQKMAETGLQCYAEMKMIFSNLHKTLH